MLACLLAYCLVLLLLVPPRLLAVPVAHKGPHLLAAAGPLPPVRHAAPLTQQISLTRTSRAKAARENAPALKAFKRC